MAGRPRYKPKPPQRERVKLLRAGGWSLERIARLLAIDVETLKLHFAVELESGADVKEAENLALAEKLARKGNASMVKWLAEKFAAGRASHGLLDREKPATPAPEPKAEKLGKKELQREAAGKVGGKFAPPAPPKLH